MNWFMLVIGVQYLGATIWEYKSNKLMALVYVCYGISAFALGAMK